MKTIVTAFQRRDRQAGEFQNSSKLEEEPIEEFAWVWILSWSLKEQSICHLDLLEGFNHKGILNQEGVERVMGGMKTGLFKVLVLKARSIAT